MTRDPHPFIARLEVRRAELGLSLDAVSALTGLSRAALSQWKNGVRRPVVENLEQYADALGMRLELVSLDTGTSSSPEAGDA